MFDKINTYWLIVFFFCKILNKKDKKAQENNLKMCTSNTWTDVFIYVWFHRLKKKQAYCKKTFFLKKKNSPDVAGMLTSIPFI